VSEASRRVPARRCAGRVVDLTTAVFQDRGAAHGGAAAIPGPRHCPNLVGPARYCWHGRVGSDGERWRLGAADDEAGGCGVGSEVGQVVRGQLGCDVPLQGPGVFGGEIEQQLAAGVGRDAFAEVAGQLRQMLVGQHEGEPVAAGFGEHLIERSGQGEEVLAFIDVEGGVDPGLLTLPGPVRGCLPDLGNDERAEQPGGVLPEDAFGNPGQQQPAVQDGCHVEAGRCRGDGAADVVAEQERSQLVQQRADDLGSGGVAHGVVAGPEAA